MPSCSHTLTRKSMLYKTKVEYGDYTMNHVQGCAHGCRFPCYAYLMAKRFGKASSYDDWCAPRLVANTLELLDAEIPRLKHKMGNVQLCFTTDPFMYGYADICALSMAAVEKLNRAGIPCTVLTKGLLPAQLAEAPAALGNTYGITLVSLSEEFRAFYEPGTAPYAERVAALRALHDAGCRTWVSMEPYPTPNIVEQSLEEVLGEVAFVDKIVFGRMNYNKAVSQYPGAKEWYARKALRVREFCEERGIECYVKKGTLPATLAAGAKAAA